MARTAQVQPFSALSTTIERRFYLRIVPLAPICISINDANQCLVINVSENGLLLSTRTGLPCNSVARIALPLDGLPKPVVVNIRVLWTSEIRRLGGIQILDVSDHDRQQHVSSTSLHREVQREPQRQPDQLRIVEPFPKTNGTSKPEPPCTRKLPLNNSAVAPSRLSTHTDRWETRRNASRRPRSVARVATPFRTPLAPERGNLADLAVLGGYH